MNFKSFCSQKMRQKTPPVRADSHPDRRQYSSSLCCFLLACLHPAARLGSSRVDASWMAECGPFDGFTAIRAASELQIKSINLRIQQIRHERAASGFGAAVNAKHLFRGCEHPPGFIQIIKVLQRHSFNESLRSPGQRQRGNKLSPCLQHAPQSARLS